MQRIVVFGTSGSGKTTFAASLSNRLAIPAIEIDSLHWGPNWTPASKQTLRDRLMHVTAGQAWVIDGNYSAVRDIVWQRADTLIWLDYPMSTTFVRVLCRTFRRWWTNEQLWAGNRERLSVQFFSRDSLFLWVVQTWRKHRRDYPRLLRSQIQQGKQVLRFRTPADASHWLQSNASRNQTREPVQCPE